MPITEAEKLRNVVLLSHSGAGKTSLSEALLFQTKAITRLGRVDDGNTVSDYEPEEVKRATSVQTSLVPCLWNGCKINVLDTPGYDDFAGEVASALRVAEGALLVVAAPSGPELGTERGWHRCQQLGMPRMIFVNKMDRENADFYRSLEQLQALFGRKCIPFQVPVGAEQDFKGVIDVLNPPADLPPGVSDRLESARDQMVEAVAETDDELITKYLEGEEITPEEIAAAAKEAVLKGQVVPVLAGSSTLGIGIEALLNAITHLLPAPPDAGQVIAERSDNESKGIEPDPDGPLAALVFKTTADQFVGKLSFFRVYRGTFRSNSEVWNQARGQSERVGQVYFPRGKTQENTQEVGPGDLAAIGKLASTLTGDTLCQREHAISFEPISFPIGYYTMAVYPKTKADLDKMSTSLARIVEEDPSLRLFRDSTTNESLLSGLGETHLEVAIERIRRKFGADLTLAVPKVAFKETIASVTRTEYKHKKQTGGHGQYGHVLLRLEPLERAQGFEFGTEVVGGSVPREYIPAVQKGVIRTLEEGVIAGYPVVDLKVVLYDGSFHDVDSSGIAFEIAASHAVRKGVSEANPTLLEPVMKLQVTVPDAFNGDVMGDLNSRRGRIIGMTSEGGQTIVEAEVAQPEILRYATDLRSLTQGRGSYTQEFSHYEVVPPAAAQKVISDAKRAKEAERA